MAYETLISCAELQAHLHAEDWVIVDCRFDFPRPEWGNEEYRKQHIAGAVFADMNRDLSGPQTEGSGRHPLPDADVFTATLSRLGIGTETQVVAYDDHGGSLASRLWFMLRMLYGHRQVAVLDGGFSAWLKEKLPVAAGWQENPAVPFKSSLPDLKQVLTTAEIEAHLHSSDWLLIDARSANRYSGELVALDPIAGHIPGAVNRFYELNLTADKHFLPAETLRAQFTELIQGFSPEKTAVYCGSGITSTQHLLAMAVAGLPLPKVYIGSWSEWIKDSRRPIIQKTTPW